jgi:hypothetical protein
MTWRKVIKAQDSGTRLSGFESSFCDSVVMWLWANWHFHSLDFSVAKKSNDPSWAVYMVKDFTYVMCVSLLSITITKQLTYKDASFILAYTFGGLSSLF